MCNTLQWIETNFIDGWSSEWIELIKLAEGANSSFSEIDKSFLTRMSDRRLSSETNELSSLSRDNRLSSVERENNKLLSPEKVLSLRRNSADVPNDQTSQPLSSLLSEDPEQRMSRLGIPFHPHTF